MYEGWQKQSSGAGLQGSIKSENTSVSSQCEPGTSAEEEEV